MSTATAATAASNSGEESNTTLPLSIISRVLSYLIHDYQELAHLRLLSKHFNNNLYSILNQAEFLKCHSNIDKCSPFVDELVKMDSPDDSIIDAMWNAHQYKMINPEGVAIVDKAIPHILHDDLMNQIDDLSKTINKQKVDNDYPSSNGIIRDLVHPALYAYVKGVSKVEKMKDVPPCQSAFEPVDGSYIGGEDDETAIEETDYWGRKYVVMTSSLKYQWLPTYFDIDTDGKCSICDYINNLTPRSEFFPGATLYLCVAPARICL
jgi:hypothetical protein